MTDKPELAARLFELGNMVSNLEEELYTGVLKIMGYNYDDPDNWPFHDITYDWYDNSFELKCDLDSKWIPTKEQMKECFDTLGFSQAWVCYGKREEEGYRDIHYGK